MPKLDNYRVPVKGPVHLADYDPAATPFAHGTVKAQEKDLKMLNKQLAQLMRPLQGENKRSVLLVLQGMDTSGKGGVLRNSVGLVDPQGVRIASFKAPTAEERSHDFLWRIERALPEAGYVGAFDRSHYEDVLIQKVRSYAPAEEIERRYGAINDFEARLVDEGFTIIKCMLHISADEQRDRLAERLNNPAKYWKYNPGDLDERSLWPAYREAYETAIERTSTTDAPWHVIPADRKWYRNWAVATLLHEALQAMELGWPPADFDVEAERQRLADEEPIR